VSHRGSEEFHKVLGLEVGKKQSFRLLSEP
jgi:hypothetical protein